MCGSDAFQYHQYPAPACWVEAVSAPFSLALLLQILVLMKNVYINVSLAQLMICVCAGMFFMVCYDEFVSERCLEANRQCRQTAELS